jgi:ferritin-like metal-binding protein YciE
MKLESLRDVLGECVRDLYSAETQLVKALPKMAKAAHSPDLRAAFTNHLEQTKTQVERLDRVCELLGVKAKGKTCHAMKGLIEEGQEVIDEKGDPVAKDAALIGAAQKVEHYEIAGYGTARTFAEVLEEDEVAALLQATLDEEGAADETLSTIAESGLNEAAAGGSEEDEDARPARNGSRKR